MEKEKLIPGWGFYIDRDTNYLVEFSSKKDDWACSYVYQILTIPPIDHKLFAPIFRHERQHVFVNDFVSRNRIVLGFWNWLFQPLLFNSFEELWIAFRSKSLCLYLREPANLIWVCYSIGLVIVILVIWWLLYVR